MSTTNASTYVVSVKCARTNRTAIIRLRTRPTLQAIDAQVTANHQIDCYVIQQIRRSTKS